MKKVLFTIVCTILLVNTLFSQVEMFARIDGHTSQISGHSGNIFYAFPLSSDTNSILSKISATSFLLATQTWAEGFVGFEVKPFSFVSVGASIGFEQGLNEPRSCFTLWMGKGRFSTFTAFEKGYGKDNWWYRSSVKYKTGNFTLGAQSWRFQGTGPLVGYQVLKHLNLWANPVFGKWGSGVVVGVGIN